MRTSVKFSPGADSLGMNGSDAISDDRLSPATLTLEGCEATPSLANLPATQGQRNAAVIVCVALLASTIAAVWSGSYFQIVLPTFVPLWATVTSLADLLAAFFIFEQFAATRVRFLAGVGAAYGFSGLLTVGYLFSFPGAFIQGRTLLGNEQSAIWLWVAWHLGFALILGWSILRDPSLGSTDEVESATAVTHRIVVGLLVTAGVACYVVFTYAQGLPALVVRGHFEAAFRLFWAPLIVVVDIAVAGLLLRRSREQTLLHLALVLALLAAACDAFLNVVSSVRYSPSWYAGKLETFLTAAIVLTALFNEISHLYRIVQEREQALSVANSGLEYQNREFEALNRELESFSYSVSHDLRAPVRAFSGYVQMLSEDYADRLDDEGRRYLDVLSSEAKRMGQLIDDLLEFSRLGRQRMTLLPIDMNALVREVVAEEQLRSTNPRVVVNIETLPAAHGDPSLLRHVWQNLISNAIKYSSKRDHPAIAISGTVDDREVIYQVQDNGAGFDMANADRLFGAFQRLHTAKEFPGTGVGLAIVQRIVTRHEGRVWADARVGEGSTFCFTLPRSCA